MSDESHDHNPLSHVLDHPTLEVPIIGREIELGSIPFTDIPITRFMVMEVVAALLVALIVIPLARHVARRPVTKGRFLNMFEAILVFIRNGLARPAIDGAHHDEGHGEPHAPHTHSASLDDDALAVHADEVPHITTAPGSYPGGDGPVHGHGHGRLSDAFLPFLWTLFFFILFCNLLGLVPGGASPTGNISVTAVLALLTLGAVITAGVRQLGPIGFWKGLVPTMDVPLVLKPFLWGLMFVIEVAGLLIKHVVLSVRLFANMLAGHIVLAVILGFVVQATGLLTYLVAPASILGVVALSLLELFVAFLQAYIFTFLAALFIGMAAHPH